MAELLMRKTAGGLAPDSDDAMTWIARKKLGASIVIEAREPRNVVYFRRWWALVKVAYDMWSETTEPQQYKGQPVMPDLDRFRRDVTILAGFFRPVTNLKGEVRLEAESIAFGNMTQERFEKLYSATINVVLNKVLSGRGLTEEKLKAMVDEILRFD